jgi:hypothetical protein
MKKSARPRLRPHGRRGCRFVGPALLGLAVLACAVPTARAGPPPPTGLGVVGGTGTWHADNYFWLAWADPAAGDPPLTGTHYRVRSPSGTIVLEDSLRRVTGGIGPLFVPKVPGIYSAEVWFVDTGGGQGPAALVPLHFDDGRPGTVAAPGSVPAWIGRTAFPLHVELGHPTGPPPQSGIRGYATTIDRDPSGSPCSHPDRCTDAETTLRGGIGDDELAIGPLPEGTSYLHAVAVSGSGMKSATGGRAVLRVDTTDPVTLLSGAPTGWTNRAVELTARASDDGSGMTAAGEGPLPFTAIRVDEGAPAIAFAPRVATSVIAEGAHRIAYYAGDAAGNADDGSAGDGTAAHQPRTALVRIDRTPPDVAFPNSQDPSDPDLIRARIADPLSGPDTTRGWIGVRRVSSGDPFERLPSAPPGPAELRAHWDSDAHPTGEYEFKAVAFDAADNSAVTTRRAGGAPMVLSNPLKATTSLRASFQPRGLSRVVPFGRGVRLRGRLVTGLNSALDGVPVRIVERFAPGARPAVRVSTVRTGPAGTFSIRTLPGPSRSVELAYEGSPTLSRSNAPALRLRVRSRVRLQASAGFARVGGKPLVFRGRIVAPAGTIPQAGMPVQLQFRLGRSPWSEFRTIQADRRGRFSYAYRFTDDDSRGARFQFRAYVPAQENWPYDPAGSRPVIVRGS